MEVETSENLSRINKPKNITNISNIIIEIILVGEVNNNNYNSNII